MMLRPNTMSAMRKNGEKRANCSHAGRKREGMRCSATWLPSSGGTGSRLKIARPALTIMRRCGTRGAPPPGRGLRRDAEHDAERDRREGAEEEVRERPAALDHVARGLADGAPEVRRVHGHGLRPADGRAEERQEQRPDGIDVGDGVQGEPAEPRRRVVPEPPRGPRMEELVEREGEQENR